LLFTYVWLLLVAMKLYLAQHGQAVDKTIDAERPLSDQGRREVSDIAAFFNQTNIEISRIYHSGKLRAAQTAGIFADILHSPQPEPMQGINPNDPVEPVIEQANQWTQDTMIVSHFPFLPHLVSVLLTGRPASESDYLPGNIVCLEADGQGNWLLAGSSSYSSFSNSSNHKSLAD
jgi:phosphohistidine phosphatase